MIQPIQSIIAEVLLILIIFVSSSFADSYVDLFNNGIDTSYWEIMSDDTLYQCDDSQGDIRFSRPAGGIQSFKSIHLKFLPVVQGDFDVRVDFFNAYINRVNGTPGNQIQLNTEFGGQVFSVVRSDEINYGHNFHVWINPPAQWRGYQANTDTAGTLRITRIDSLVTGYFNSTVIFSDIFNEAEIALLTFSLQNNGTTDSTSVIFDNFMINADSIAQIPTGIKESDLRSSGFKLHQNYPNPFNPTTQIPYTLPQSNTVSLIIYDLSGKEVQTLVNDYQTVGSYSVNFNASRLSSGIYFYQLKVGNDFVSTKKMVLTR